MVEGGGKRSKKKRCFVIGPIGKDGSPERKHSDLLLHAVIKSVIETEEFDMSVKRADDDADPGMIGDRIISDILNSELVVADLTDLNPNVFYELGIRHSTQKPTIHIARLGTALPFDNISHRTIFVDLSEWASIIESRTRLSDAVRIAISDGYKPSNPITQANANFKLRTSDDPNDRTIADLQDRLASLESAITRNSDRATLQDLRGLHPPSSAVSGEMIRRYREKDSNTNDLIRYIRSSNLTSKALNSDFVSSEIISFAHENLIKVSSVLVTEDKIVIEKEGSTITFDRTPKS